MLPRMPLLRMLLACCDLNTLPSASCLQGGSQDPRQDPRHCGARHRDATQHPCQRQDAGKVKHGDMSQQLLACGLEAWLAGSAAGSQRRCSGTGLVMPGVTAGRSKRRFTQ